MEFKEWYDDEKNEINDEIKRKTRIFKILKWIYISIMLMILYVELGSVYTDFTMTFIFLAVISIIYFVFYFIVVDPKKPIRIFDESIKKAFIFDEDKKRFIEEINTQGKLVIKTHLNLKMQPGTVIFTENFCYIDMITPLRKQILRISDIKKVSLKKVSDVLSIGFATKIRDAYAIVLHIKNGDKKENVIRFLFINPEEANDVMRELSPMINIGGEIENDVEFAKTEEGKRKDLKEVIQCLIIGIIVLILLALSSKWLK